MMLVVSALTASAQKIDPQHYTFEQFITDFKRSYRPDSPEYALRQQIFEENLCGVRAHNAAVNQSWKLGINRFSDQTANESAAFLGYNRLAEYGYDRKALKKHQGPDLAMMPDAGPLPNAVDWSARPGTPLHTWSNAPSLMTGQKEQGSCGSCWALAVAANVESHTALKTGSLPVLSSQQLLSCSPNPHHCGGKGGCDGSTPMLAYEYAQENGLVTEESFTYTAIDCIDCDGVDCDACNRCSSIGAHAVVSLHAPILTTSFHPTHPYPHNPCARASIMTPIPARQAHLQGWHQLKENDHDDVIHALATVGPLVVGVAAGAWFTYSGGVFGGCTDQSELTVNHAVQLVGYGTDPEHGDYWKIRNWWGSDWGEDGYMRLRRSAPTCSVDSMPKEGFGCDNGPPSVTVCGECGILYSASYPIIQ